MSKKLRFNAAQIPPTALVQGTAFDIKCFPSSQAGRMAPFSNPPPQPPTMPTIPPAATPAMIRQLTQQHFDACVAFFVDHVGSSLEKLNGLQFNLDVPGTGGTAGVANMGAELVKLANALGMARPGTANSRSALTWPLEGAYKITWTLPEAKKIGFDSLVLELDFENEPDYLMVVNCCVELATTFGSSALAPVSSSSSYIATSSSS